MFMQCVYTSGKEMQIEADKLYNDSKTLRDFIEHFEQNTRKDRCDSSYGLLKTIYHFRKNTKCCKTFVLMFVRCIARI